MKTILALCLFGLAVVAQAQTVSFTLTLTDDQAIELTNTVRFVNDTRMATYSAATNAIGSENARILAANPPPAPPPATNAYPPYPVALTEQQYVTFRTAELLTASPRDRRKARADEAHATIDGLPEDKLRQVKAFLNSLK